MSVAPLSLIRLMGGLGNQMFQYALGRRMAEETGAQVKFDIDSGFKNDPYGRRFALDLFNTRIVSAGPQEVPAGMAWTRPWHRLAQAAWNAVPIGWRRVMYERVPFQFDASVLAGTNAPTYYFGYWQNQGYLSTIQPILRREFTLRESSHDTVTQLQEAMAACRSISVHVRQHHGIGADGKVIGKARAHHGACTAEYYQQACERIGLPPGTVCFVFSDNLRWAKQNLRLPVPCRFVADECSCSEAAEMLLMASCQHHVISNSSFSWWGAWLGANPEKIVVAPKQWISALPPKQVPICPSEWVRI